MAVLSIISKTLPPVEVGEAYSEQLQVVGGVGPYAWTLVGGFGTFPTGIVLSSSGILSAPGGAINPGQVGDYNFRLQAQDSGTLTDVYDYTMRIIPFGFNRVPSYLLDGKLEDVSAQQLIEDLSRLKNERHFWRGALGSAGTPWVHQDEDIKVPDWLTPANDLGLRDILDELYGLGAFSMKSINSILPDWLTRNFDILEGTGIAISPLTNGLRLDVDLSGLISVTPLEKLDTLVPSSTSDLILTADALISQLYIKAADNEWYPRASIPSNAGKRLNPLTAGSGLVGMAVGDDTVIPVVHVCWLNGVGDVMLERYDGETLALIESLNLGTFPLISPPLVMVGNLGQVIVCFTDSTNAMFFGVFNPQNYLDTSSPTYLNPVAPMPAGVAGPNPTTGSLAGTVPPASSAAAGLCYVGFDVGGAPTIAEFDVATPGTSGGWVQAKALPSGAAILDIVVDSASNILNIASLDGIAGPSDNIDYWQDAVPMVPGPIVGFTTAIALGAPGSGVTNASLVIANSVMSPGARASMLVYPNNQAQWPFSSTIEFSTFDNVQIIPIAPPVYQNVWPSLYSVSGVDSAFLKDWVGDECDSVVLFPTTSGTEGEVERLILGVNNVLKEQGVLRRAKPSPAWIKGAHTSELTPQAQVLRFYDEQDVFGAAETTFSVESLRLVHDPVSNVLTAINDSPFTWDIRMVAIEKTGTTAPANLLVPCWQLAQELQNYYNVNGWYPSPSTSGANGVTWSETELATTATLGIFFGNYYTVTPGTWDLNGGTIAAAYYHSNQGAGVASDQTLSFRYTYNPPEIIAAEATIKVSVDTFISTTPPIPPAGGGFYTLAELDSLLGTSYATTYAGAPYDLYEYRLFVDPTGLLYHHGFFSRNYVQNANAFGPAPASTESIPVVEHFGPLTSGDSDWVPHDFTLAQGVLSARVMVNGIEYYQGIHWIFVGNDVVRWLNDPADYVLQTGDRISIWKYVAV